MAAKEGVRGPGRQPGEDLHGKTSGGQGAQGGGGDAPSPAHSASKNPKKRNQSCRRWFCAPVGPVRFGKGARSIGRELQGDGGVRMARPTRHLGTASLVAGP